MSGAVYDEGPLRAAGFSDDEIAQDKATQGAGLASAGFSPQEVNDYVGVKTPDVSAAKNYVEANLNAYNQAKAPENATSSVPGDPSQSNTAHPAKGYWDALEAGWQTSVSGLITRHEMPDTVLPENADMAMTALKGAGQFAGDIPAMAAGKALGGAIGAVGGPIGSAMGSAAGTWAAPAALRSLYMDQIKKGDVSSFSDFFARAGGATWEAMKGAATGVATEGVGGVAADALTTAPAIAQVAGKTAAQLATMTTVGKAMEGQMPQPRDFADGAVMLLGLHGLGEAMGQGADFTKDMTGKLQDIYAKTGLKPEDVLSEAQTNPVVKQQLLSDEKGIPDQFKGLVETPKLPVDYEGKAADYDQQIKVLQGVDGKTSEQQEQYTQLIQDRDEHNTQWAEHQKALDGAYPPEPETVDAKIPAELSGQSDVLGKGFAPEDNFKVPKPPELLTAPRDDDQAGAQSARDKILSRIGTPSDDLKTQGWDNWYTKTVDKLNPVAKLRDALTGGDELPKSQDPYALLSTSLSRGFAKADSAITNEMEPILDKFKDDPDGFKAYGMAKRALERDGKGFETGFDLDAAKEYVDANKTKYEKDFQKVVDFQNDGIQQLHDAGVISDESLKNILDNSTDYFPMRRIMDSDAGGSGGTSSKSPLKGFEGSERQIVDPFEQIINNRYAFSRMAEENIAKQSIVKLANQYGQMDSSLIERVPQASKPVDASPEELTSYLAKYGIDDTDPEALQLWRPMAKPLGPDEMSVMNKGKQEIYSVDPSVAKALSATAYSEPNLVMKVANAFATAQRVGITENPFFLLKHGIRSEFTAFEQSNNGYRLGLDGLRGLAHYFSDSDDYHEFLNNGGGMSTLVDFDKQYVRNDVWGLSKDTGLLDKMTNVVKTPFDMFRVLAEGVYTAPKIGEYLRAKEAGKDSFTAAYEGRNVTADMQKTGSSAFLNAWSAATPFMNMRIRGMDQMVQAFQDNPSRTMTKMALSIALPSLATWWMYKDDDRYKGAPQWEKDLSWVVPTGDPKTGATFRIPKPFEPGLLFGSLVERTMNDYYDKNPNAFKNFGASLMGGVFPNVIPPVVMPALEQFGNRSWLTGGNIVPHTLEDVAPAYQYTPYTSETAKALGKLISYIPGVRDIGHGNDTLSSPMVLENYIRQWTGETGMYALQVADKGLQASGITNLPAKPTSTLSDIPYIKGFMVRYPSASDQRIQDFYDNLNKAQTRAATISSLVKRGNIGAAQDYMASPEAQENMVKLTGVAHALSVQNQLIHTIYADPKQTPNDKRENIDNIYHQMIQAATLGNQITQHMESQ